MTEKIERAIDTLVPIVKDMHAVHANELEEHKKGRNQLHADDFFWRRLLVSMATMGNSRGWDGLIGDESNYRLVTFESLSDLNPDQRSERLRTVLRRSKVRMADQKAEWLAENYDRIVAMGGLQATNERFRAMKDTEEIITFLRSFTGIGPKYARNIPMDVYHPAFRNSVAVDERIQNVTEALGLSFTRFEQHEGFYLDVAERAGIEGWELDRLLYNFTDEALERLRSGRTESLASSEMDSPGTQSDSEGGREMTPKSGQTNVQSNGQSNAGEPAIGDAAADRRDLFTTVQGAFVEAFPAVHSYTRANGWFYGRGTHVFFVAKPGPRGRGVEFRLHASKNQLPDTHLELIEKAHSGRADPPVQHAVIDSLVDVSEAIRLARFAYRHWGSA